MMRKVTALLAATALAATALAPTAEARDYYHGYGHYRPYYGHRYYGYGHGDAVAAGLVGLFLGLAVGSAANRDRGCYDNCGSAPPPPPPQYQGYDPGRGGPPAPQNYSRDGSAYEEDYGVDPKLDGGPQPQTCTHQEWDRYANRYVTVNVPC
jgi:hypothetical protein